MAILARPSARVVVVGAGPAGLMAAETLARAGVAATVVERMPSPARKFLMAGRGGLNLTHSEDHAAFLGRYGDSAAALAPALAAFPPDRLRAWCEALGQPTFVGSSGRVFPQTFKASPLLRAWLRELERLGVRVLLRHSWTGWTATGEARIERPEGCVALPFDAMVLALGGASWPRLGSDGGWAGLLARDGIAVAPLRPSNCGFSVRWSDVFRQRFEGQPLKRVALTADGRSVRGEVVITAAGIEGGAVYALSPLLRERIAAAGFAMLHLALRPDLDTAALAARLSRPRGKDSLANHLRKALSLSPAAIGLLQEAAVGQGQRLSDLTAGALAELINRVPLRLDGVAPIERAISSAGGVTWSEVDAHFMLRKRPGVFVAGEMLDWEAPTGGYLLQACFATGHAAGLGALRWLGRGAADAERASAAS